MKKIDTKAITIRPVCAEDEGQIAAFFDAMGAESRALFNRRDYNRNRALKFCRRPDPTRRYWIAEIEGEMVGCVFFLDYNTAIPELGVAVRDDLCGRGLGRYLVSHAMDMAEKEGKGGIQLTTHTANLRAQALYESLGFVCKGLAKNGTELFYLWCSRRGA